MCCITPHISLLVWKKGEVQQACPCEWERKSFSRYHLYEWKNGGRFSKSMPYVARKRETACTNLWENGEFQQAHRTWARRERVSKWHHIWESKGRVSANLPYIGRKLENFSDARAKQSITRLRSRDRLPVEPKAATIVCRVCQEMHVSTYWSREPADL